MSSDADPYERYAAPLTDRFTDHVLDLAGDVRGRVVCDVAGGTGLVAREAARRGARRVLGADLLDWMAARARQRNAEASLDAIRIARMDAMQLGLRDRVADLTLCQFGLMLMAEPERAARELRRVTRPGGIVVVAVWSTPDRAPAFSAFLDAVGEVVLGEPISPGHAVFRLGGEGALAALLAAAGLHAVEERRVVELDVRPSFDAYWDGMSSLVGFRAGPDPDAPVTMANRLDDDTQARIRQGTLERAAAWLRPDGSLAFPMQAVLVRAVVPSR